MSDEHDNSGTDGVGSASPKAEAPAAEAPVSSGTSEAPVEELGCEARVGTVAQVLAAVPCQYWGVDTSYDDVSFEDAVRLKVAGVRVAFQCIWTGIERPPTAIANIRNYHDAGLITCGYLSVSAGRSGLQHLIEGYDNLPQDTRGFLRDVAIDVELPNMRYDFHVEPAIEGMGARGYRKMVYTSYNAWKNLLGDPTPPAGTLLWNAFWDNDPDFDFERFPYGHSNFVLIGEQYTGGEDVEGVFADRSLFVEWAFPEPEAPPEPEVVYDFRDVVYIMTYLINGLADGVQLMLSPEDKAILKAYVGGL